MKNSKFGPITKLYFTLSLLTFFVFMLISTGSLMQTHMSASPYKSMKGVASSVSSQFFVDMLSMEVPGMVQEQERTALSLDHVVQFVFRYLTDINPNDPKSLIAMEVPGIGHDEMILLRSSENPKQITSPLETTPPKDVLQPSTPSEPNEQPDAESNEEIPNSENQQEEPATQEPPKDPEPEKPTTNGIVKAFIYHTHNRESWLPELNKKDADFSEAFDDKINITMLGDRLAEKLEEHGIGAVSSNTDYPTEVKDYNWNFSYKYSNNTVTEAAASYPELEYYFDLHRDAQNHDKTTVNINGKNYAQVYFIIGHRNPNWEKNEAFAAKIHEKLEAEFPGLSRGIWGKSEQSGHGEYNQSISPNSILIEIGGPENTLEESYRTIDVLSDIIAEIFWDAKEVNAPVSVGKSEEQSS